MTKTNRTKRVLLIGLLTAMISQALWTQSATAIQPEPVEIVVWTVNTAFYSQAAGRPCSNIGCQWSNFSTVVASHASCPDIVFGQEIKTTADADRFKSQLDQISTSCGVYRRYFYNAGGEEIGKVAIGWRAERFVHAKDSAGNWDVDNKRERWQSASGCTGLTDLGSGQPSRHVSAVRLLDQKIAGKSIIAASIHWDAGLSTDCMSENLNNFGNRIQAKWGSSMPVVLGGDHNRNNGQGSTEEVRREQTLKPWYTSFRATGYSDAISTHYTSLDTNVDGNSDICEHWTYVQDLHADAASNACSEPGHTRFDFTWYRNLLNTQAFTDKGYVGTKGFGKFYSDHRSVVSKYTYSQ